MPDETATGAPDQADQHDQPGQPASDDAAATVHVLRGTPTPQDLAVIAAVLATRSATAVRPSGEPARRTWAAYWRQPAQPARPGPGAWRSSVRPR